MNELSRGQLAKKVGVTEQAIWQYENGYTSPKLDVVNRFKCSSVRTTAFFRRRETKK
ncbi:helix-turn-helix transcriptional regulator [Sporosarcina sp.]|uniref:helix-turn-helix domain-containing protein n=1 Tax=Sporosarcina sp. TaxID=49982 RepID=UPI00261266E0|nr:helix-turn-helix transcriptional regulator [Sporosarcina sp.]